MKLNSSPRNAGFTLIEILVVIGIIAILATLAFGAMGSSKRAAAAANCSANMRQLGALTLTYANENNGEFPFGGTWDKDIAPLGGVTDFKKFWPLLKCAADPRVETATLRPRSYAASAMSNPDNGRGVFSRDLTKVTPSRTLAQILEPQNTIMLCEKFTDANAASNQYGGAFAYLDGWLGGVGPKNPDGSYYHRSGNNYLFCDGHVETAKVEQVYNNQTKINRWKAF